MASAFGAAASVAVVLVWVYYAAQIFLLGAEFTWVYAHTFGSLKGQERQRAPGTAVAKGGQWITTPTTTPPSTVSSSVQDPPGRRQACTCTGFTDASSSLMRATAALATSIGPTTFPASPTAFPGRVAGQAASATRFSVRYRHRSRSDRAPTAGGRRIQGPGG